MAAPIVLATCRTWPELSASDRCLAEALRVRGHRVEAAPWNGPFEPFIGAAAVVIRSTWDYHQDPDAYRAWLDRLPPERTFNTPDLIRWNLSKAHVLDLGARGAPVPRARLVAATATAVAQALEALGLADGVLKPAIGASGFGVERVRRGDEAAALARAGVRKSLDQVLVQEFVTGIEHGELAGVFFDGAFSHGLRRVPAPGEFRINSQYGGRMEAATLPDAVVRQMAGVLALLPAPALYARVDGVAHGARFALMEVEVNEPGLGMDHVPSSATVSPTPCLGGWLAADVRAWRAGECTRLATTLAGESVRTHLTVTARDDAAAARVGPGRSRGRSRRRWTTGPRRSRVVRSGGTGSHRRRPVELSRRPAARRARPGAAGTASRDPHRAARRRRRASRPRACTASVRQRRPGRCTGT